MDVLLIVLAALVLAVGMTFGCTGLWLAAWPVAITVTVYLLWLCFKRVE